MSDRRPRSIHLADVAALAVAVGQDEQQAATERAARDRRIGVQIPLEVEDRVATSIRWLDALRAEDPALEALHAHVQQSLSWAQLGLLAVGLLTGWLAALGVLYYDGSSRINVVALVGVLVLLPGLFLAAFVLAALPSAAISRVPFAAPMAALTRSLSPGRLAVGARRFLPSEMRQSWETIGAHLSAHRVLYGRLQRWALLRGSQLFALGFQLAALSASLALVIFSDLAFGWSTTLTSGDPGQDATRVHTLTSMSATPWSWAVPKAAPPAELVAESRVYRAAHTSIDAPMAARLGGWWPFVVMVLLVYGLLPRVITVLVADQRLRSTSRATLLATPGLTQILHRLHRAHIATTSADPESSRPSDRRPERTLDPTGFPSPAPGAIVNWAGIELSKDVLGAAFGNAPVYSAGGERSLANDNALADKLAAARIPDRDLIVLAVKAWEPPLLEVNDFLRVLRTALGPGRPILVVPMGLNANATAPAPPPGKHLQTWQDKLRLLGDPWLQVVPFSPQGLS